MINLEQVKADIRELEAEAKARGVTFATQAKFTACQHAINILEAAREKQS